ncbi:hypothetical protein JHK82_052731 [Glycine max]|nr:hypothetical protein JHK86_052580 [Glycine max]KAG4926942.1 hypothetical protein JHK85_053428 [Glycine max]KAG5082579.1 hypothetical protein JHK84_052617 [Glycine max]KAG5085334.1 hypothetical protein JHK82_052731 [Glycine max]
MMTPSSSSSASHSQFSYSNPSSSSYFPVPFHLQLSATTHYAALYVVAPSVQIPAPPIVGPIAPVPIITPEALENVKAAVVSSDVEHKIKNLKFYSFN